MSAPAFYAAERLRWPELDSLNITDSWAKRALKKLTRHFLGTKAAPVPLRFAGRTTSWGGADGITLAKNRTWLIFLHEFAHVWEYRKHGQTEHRKRLAKLVDRACRYAIKMGWAEADLEEQFNTWCADQAEEEARDEALTMFAPEPSEPGLLVGAV